jgi:hypothetical protein
MNKFATVSVGLSAIIFTVLIPILELNSTHLTNPNWPSHARLHEAWQLLTNALISLLALGCVWTSKAPRIGISLALVISVSFLTAWVFGSAYGGSMLHSDGTQLAVGGINLAVIIVSVLTVLLAFSLWTIRHPKFLMNNKT